MKEIERKDYINYRIEKSNETFEVAELLELIKKEIEKI